VGAQQLTTCDRGWRRRGRPLAPCLAAAAACLLAWPVAADAIIGGRPAEAGTYPWLAHVIDSLKNEEVGCTGTVVAPRLVLTAAHCLTDEETGEVNGPAGFTVVTGNVDWHGQPRELRHVSQVVVAPGYEASTGVDDAALLVLARPTSAPAIALAQPGYDAPLLQAGTIAWMVGWGDKAYGQHGFTASLQEAPTAVQESGWCEANAPPFYAQGQLCAIEPSGETTGTCEGDSGGPLIVGLNGEERREEEWIELGLLIGNFNDCATTLPSVYTRVDALYSWIERWIGRAEAAIGAGRRGPVQHARDRRRRS
jgi:secreted trypsin-like serine protease